MSEEKQEKLKCHKCGKKLQWLEFSMRVLTCTCDGGEFWASPRIHEEYQKKLKQFEIAYNILQRAFENRKLDLLTGNWDCVFPMLELADALKSIRVLEQKEQVI